MSAIARPELRRFWRRRRDRPPTAPLHLMMLPAVAAVAIFAYLPMYGVIMAFQYFQPALGLFGPQVWVGWDNFRYVFSLPNFGNVIFNTFAISAWKIVLGLALPVGVALLLNEMGNAPVKRTIQSVIYMPHFLSWVILGGIFLVILSPNDGLVNSALGWLGIEGTDARANTDQNARRGIFFLGSNRWFRFTVVTTHLWKEVGWGTIIYLAALTGIDENLYAAASIDGASRLQQTRYVTIPGISHVIVLLGVLSLGQALNAGFDQIFNLYSPVVYETGDIISTFVYRVGILEAQYSVAAAVGLFQSVVSLVLISVSYWLAVRYADYRIF